MTTTPENTSQRDPLIHLAGSMSSRGFAGYVDEMETAGQRQVLHSDVLPTQGPWGELEELGFVAGEVVDDDPLFRRCTLPNGWAREGSSHSMWSYLIDERGVRRIGVFYKAAFYDRRAQFHIESPGRVLATEAVYGDEPGELPMCWGLLTGEERAEFVEGLDDYLARAAEHPGIYGDRAARARAVRKLARP